MTIQTDRVQEIFQDARVLQAAAVERLDHGDIRDAAEKAWGATKRATDALILARTGEEPERTPETGAGLNQLAFQDPCCPRCPHGRPILHPPGTSSWRMLLQRPLRPHRGHRAPDPGNGRLHRRRGADGRHSLTTAGGYWTRAHPASPGSRCRPTATGGVGADIRATGGCPPAGNPAAAGLGI